MDKKKDNKGQNLSKGSGSISKVDKGRKSNRVQRENVQELVRTCKWCLDVIVKEEFTKHKRECTENPKNKSKKELELMISRFKTEMENTIKNIKIDNVIVPKKYFGVIASRWLMLQRRSAFDKTIGSENEMWKSLYKLLLQNNPEIFSKLNDKLAAIPKKKKSRKKK